MSFAVVGHTSGVSSDGGNTASAGPVDSSLANLVVLARVGAGASATISDSFSNTYTPLTLATGGVGVGTQLYYCEGPTVGTGHTFMVSGAASFPSIYVLLLSGAAGGGQAYEAEGSAGAHDTPTTTVQTGVLTPHTSNELVVSSLWNNNGSGTPSIDSGFTVIEYQDQTPGQSYGGALAYLIQGATALVQPTWTKANDASAASIATFKPQVLTGITATVFEGRSVTTINW